LADEEELETELGNAKASTDLGGDDDDDVAYFGWKEDAGDDDVDCEYVDELEKCRAESCSETTEEESQETELVVETDEEDYVGPMQDGEKDEEEVLGKLILSDAEFLPNIASQPKARAVNLRAYCWTLRGLVDALRKKQSKEANLVDPVSLSLASTLMATMTMMFGEGLVHDVDWAVVRSAAWVATEAEFNDMGWRKLLAYDEGRKKAFMLGLTKSMGHKYAEMYRKHQVVS